MLSFLSRFLIVALTMSFLFEVVGVGTASAEDKKPVALVFWPHRYPSEYRSYELKKATRILEHMLSPMEIKIVRIPDGPEDYDEMIPRKIREAGIDADTPIAALVFGSPNNGTGWFKYATKMLLKRVSDSVIPPHQVGKKTYVPGIGFTGSESVQGPEDLMIQTIAPNLTTDVDVYFYSAEAMRGSVESLKDRFQYLYNFINFYRKSGQPFIDRMNVWGARYYAIPEDLPEETPTMGNHIRRRLYKHRFIYFTAFAVSAGSIVSNAWPYIVDDNRYNKAIAWLDSIQSVRDYVPSWTVDLMSNLWGFQGPRFLEVATYWPNVFDVSKWTLGAMLLGTMGYAWQWIAQHGKGLSIDVKYGEADTPQKRAIFEHVSQLAIEMRMRCEDIFLVQDPAPAGSEWEPMVPSNE